MRLAALLIVFGALAVFTAGCTERTAPNPTPAKGPDPAPPPVAENPGTQPSADLGVHTAGRKVFDMNCQKCHSTNAPAAANPGGPPVKGWVKGGPNLSTVGAKRTSE